MTVSVLAGNIGQVINAVAAAAQRRALRPLRPDHRRLRRRGRWSRWSRPPSRRCVRPHAAEPQTGRVEQLREPAARRVVDDLAQTASRLLPLRWLNDGMLDVMVRGEAWTAALVPMAVLAGFALVVTGIAAKVFRWETN